METLNDPSKDAIARENWHRYEYGRDHGHREYIATARKNEGFYLGGGEQWDEDVKAQLEDEGRPTYEFNEVLPSVNSALGYQIQNRMDIACRPRGGRADATTAKVISKVCMQVADANRLRWLETQVFADGLVEQRGYLEIRMSFDKNMLGEISLSQLDPRDVIPDPDAKVYDPDGWSDVIITRFLTADEVAGIYGEDARKIVEASGDEGIDHGSDSSSEERNRFGMEGAQNSAYDAYTSDIDGVKRWRIIDRQRWVYEPTACLILPDTGDVVIRDHLSDAQGADLIAAGATLVKRMKRRVRWQVSTYSRTVHDKLSPYEHFTPIPFFAYFRRGKTRGMVDNAIGPQEALNKGVSQFVHILNTTANSGWIVRQNSLTNMDTDELETRGAQSGLVVEVAEGATPPQKIEPNQIPSGIDRLIDRATQALKDVTVPDSMRGLQGNAVSGVAKQADQFASQQQLAVPLDNLNYTRHLLAGRMIKLVQRYYDSYRMFRITETDPASGKEVETMLEINKFDPESGAYLNDVTVGTYDVVVTEQPMQVTFQNSQFEQAMEMRKNGIMLPDRVVIKYSNLADKHEILDTLPPQEADPTIEAKANLLKAQAAKTDAETTAKNVETQYSAVQSAQVLAAIPQAAMTADALLRSAGYVDHDAAPIVPMPSQPALPAPGGLPTNTNPLTPANPAVGMKAGIETPAADGLAIQ